MANGQGGVETAGIVADQRVPHPFGRGREIAAIDDRPRLPRIVARGNGRILRDDEIVLVVEQEAEIEAAAGARPEVRESQAIGRFEIEAANVDPAHIGLAGIDPRDIARRGKGEPFAENGIFHAQVGHPLTVQVRDRVFQQDLIPVERELQPRQEGRREDHAHGRGVGRFRPQREIAAAEDRGGIGLVGAGDVGVVHPPLCGAFLRRRGLLEQLAETGGTDIARLGRPEAHPFDDIVDRADLPAGGVHRA